MPIRKSMLQTQLRLGPFVAAVQSTTAGLYRLAGLTNAGGLLPPRACASTVVRFFHTAGAAQGLQGTPGRDWHWSVHDKVGEQCGSVDGAAELAEPAGGHHVGVVAEPVVLVVRDKVGLVGGVVNLRLEVLRVPFFQLLVAARTPPRRSTRMGLHRGLEFRGELGGSCLRRAADAPAPTASTRIVRRSRWPGRSWPRRKKVQSPKEYSVSVPARWAGSGWRVGRSW